MDGWLTVGLGRVVVRLISSKAERHGTEDVEGCWLGISLSAAVFGVGVRGAGPLPLAQALGACS